MPLEKVFSRVKYTLRNNDNAYLSTSKPAELVKLAFCAVTKTDCINYSASSLEEPQFQCFTHLVFLNTGAKHRYIMHFKIDIHVL